MIFTLKKITDGISTLECRTPTEATTLYNMLFNTYWAPVSEPSLVITKADAYSITLNDLSVKTGGK